MPKMLTILALIALLAVACLLPFVVAYIGGWNFERNETAKSAAAVSAAFLLVGCFVIGCCAMQSTNHDYSWRLPPQVRGDKRTNVRE